MLIVCTKDQRIIDWTNDINSGAMQWGAIHFLNVAHNQAQATAQLAGILAGLANNEYLCLSAHGNDTEIGDEGSGPNDWVWTTNQIAAMLAANAPGHTADILIRACAHTVANFSAGLAVALVQRHALNHVWIYGYNIAIWIWQNYPNPVGMGKRVDLQGTQVHF